MRITTYSVEALQGPPGVDASGVDLGAAGQLGVGAAWARVAPGLRSVANQHDEIETWVVVAGEGEVYADAERRRVSAGTVVQFEPFETHFVDNSGDTDLVFASFYWRDGERAARAAEHRRLRERSTFVFSSPPGHLAADVFVRYQRMTGAGAWHLTGAGDAGAALTSLGIEVDQLTAAGEPGERFDRPAPSLDDLRADVEVRHRLGRVPASVKELAHRRLAGAPPEGAAAGGPERARAFEVLRGIEELGSRLGRDWRADAPEGEWKIVRFLGADDAFEQAVLHPALYGQAHPGWTPDIDYHLVEPPAPGAAELAARGVDAARLALAAGRPEGVGDALDAWQRWLSDLGSRVEARYGGVAPDAGIWTPEQSAFLARLDRRLAEITGCLGPDDFSPARASAALCGLVEDVTAFAGLQAPLAGVEAWKDEARTAIALELAAARLLAACSAPILPGFAARLAAALGEAGPAEWPRRTALVQPGARLDLAGRDLFVARAEAPPLLPWLAGLVRAMLRLPEDQAVQDRTLVSLGMESLQAIALQFRILEQTGADVSVEDLLGARDVAELAAFIASGLEPEVIAARTEVAAQ